MNLPFPKEVLDRFAQETQHFMRAPDAFLEAWKRGVTIAGPQWFGDGTRDGVQRATRKWDLSPRCYAINDNFGVLSGGERMFLAAMVSIYSGADGGNLLRRCGFEGLCDLGGLDLQRRQVIADLLLNYSGW
jgi:hypothetical protein